MTVSQIIHSLHLVEKEPEIYQQLSHPESFLSEEKSNPLVARLQLLSLLDQYRMVPARVVNLVQRLQKAPAVPLSSGEDAIEKQFQEHAYALASPEGEKLLQNYGLKNVRLVVLSESFHGSRCKPHWAKEMLLFPIVKEALSEREQEVIQKAAETSLQISPPELLPDIFLYRMKNPKYRDWCVKALKTHREVLKRNSLFLMEHLASRPPSPHRTLMAACLFCAFETDHPSLDARAFRLEPEDTLSSRVYMDDVIYDGLVLATKEKRADSSLNFLRTSPLP